jgi:acyl dehydratase
MVEIDELQTAVNYGLNKVRFPASVPVDSRLRFTGEILSATEKPTGIEVIYRLNFEVDGGRRPACIAEAVVLYR